MINKKFAFIIVSFTIIAIGWITLDYKEAEVSYISITDLLRNHQNYKYNKIRLGGVVKPNSINYSPDRLTINFNLNQGEHSLPVKYFSAAIPDLFGDSAEVIIEGKYINEIFIAENLMTKCASKYEENANYTKYNGN